MEILANYGTVLIIVAAVFGFLMAIGIGANDVANAMGTSVGSKALTVKQAIIIAMIFEFAGAYLAYGEVTETIRNGVIETSLFADKPDVLIYGMMSAPCRRHLVTGGVLHGLASLYHSLYHRRYYWFRVRFCRYRSGRLELSKRHCRQLDYYSGDFRLLCVPHFVSAQRLIFDTEKPLINAKRFVRDMFITTMVIALVTIKKVLNTSACIFRAQKLGCGPRWFLPS